MKLFITKTLKFLLIVVSFFFILELTLWRIPNNYSFKKKYLDKHASKIETLILGNSHSFYGINPVYFKSNTFNAALNAQSLKYDFLILDKYKKKLNSLKTIVIPISYFSYFLDLENSVEGWRIKNYVLYFGFYDVYEPKYYSEILSNNLKNSFSSFENYYLKNNSKLTCSMLGWGTNFNSKSAKNIKQSAEFSAKRHSAGNIKSIANRITFNKNLYFLKKIFKLCYSNKINLILFIPPAHNNYVKILDKDQLSKTERTTSRLSKKYSNCIYLNLLKDTLFKTSDYYDADHLSEIGAKKLSIKINKIVNSLN